MARCVASLTPAPPPPSTARAEVKAAAFSDLPEPATATYRTAMAFERLYQDEEPQRINRWLAQTGICSRREAEALIAAGQVSIDGEVVRDLGRKILNGQRLVLTSQAQTSLSEALSVVLNKPVGVVSAQPERGQIPAARLLTSQALVGEAARHPDRSTSLAPVGRLDQDSRGLLILSEDGVLTRAVIGPQSGVQKEYRVRVEGAVTSAKLDRLRHGLQLDGRALRPAEVERLGQGLSFVLTEGRNRQIRRMCELVGLSVVDLQRVRIGPVKLGNLPEGRWRLLSPAERSALIAGAAEAFAAGDGSLAG